MLNVFDPEVVMKTVRRRRLSTLVAVLAVAAATAAVLVPAGLASSGGTSSTSVAAPAALPTLYVRYQDNCTFSVFNDAGQQVSSIAPGKYQVDVSTPIMFKLLVPAGPSADASASNDFTGCKGWVQFQLTGPGINLFTTLDSGCDSNDVIGTSTFQPSSTYVFQDLNQPSVTKMSITTLATGTPTPPATTPYDATSGKGTTSQDIVGSDRKAAVIGTLTGALSSNGSPTLMLKGKPVATLKAGRYTFRISDQDAKASFTIQAAGGKQDALTTPSFVGKHSVTVTLTAGNWMYFGTGKARSFTVR